MVEFDITINKKQQTAYFSKNIVKTLGYNLSAQLNAVSGIIYPKNAKKEDIIRSVEILLEDLRHQTKLEKKVSSQ